MVERAYPVRSQSDDDARFTFGLVRDVAEVLVRHGYPSVSGVDLVDLRQVLFQFLYGAGGR